MANNILSVIWITDQHWSYYYLLIGFLLLIICFLLYRLRQLKKNIGKEQDYYHSLFDILDNLPFPIMVKISRIVSDTITGTKNPNCNPALSGKKQ